MLLARMLLIPTELYYYRYLHQKKTNLIYWSIDKSKVFLDNHMCEISQLKSIQMTLTTTMDQNIKIHKCSEECMH